MAGDDPVKIREFEKMPVLEYLMILDKKIAESKKAMAQIRRDRANNH
jgi:hypothetical protein